MKDYKEPDRLLALLRCAPQGLSLTALLLCSFTAQAELVLCDGIWTNDTCEGILEKQVGASKELNDEEQAAVERRSAKNSLLHEATMQAIEAKREYGVDISPERAREVCRDKDSSIEECREHVEEFTEKLDVKVARAVQIAREKREAKREQEVLPPPMQTTVIIDERPIYVVPRRHKYPHGHHGAHGHYGQHGSAGVNLSTKSGNTSLEVGVSGGTYSGSRTDVDSVGTVTSSKAIGSQGSAGVAQQPRPSGSSFERRTLRQPFSANRMQSIR